MPNSFASTTFPSTDPFGWMNLPAFGRQQFGLEEHFVITATSNYNSDSGTNAGTIAQANASQCRTGAFIATTAAVSAFDYMQVYRAVSAICPVPGKKFAWEARLQVGRGAGAAGVETWFAGVTSAQTDAAFFSDLTTRAFDNGIGIGHISAAGQQRLSIFQGNADTFTQTLTDATYAYDQWMTVTIQYTGTHTYFYANGRMIGSVLNGANLPSSNMAAYCFWIANGETAAKTIMVDCVRLAMEL